MRRCALLSLLLLGCEEHKPIAKVDHVIVGISDLTQGMDQIERLTGIRPAVGGAHPSAGTQNALLSLGDGTYLEIYAPNPAEPVESAEVAELRALKRLTPIGWAVSTDAAAGLRTELKVKGFELTPPEPGSRRKPDGAVLSWVTYGFAELDHPLAPFFIKWSDPALHPSRTSPRGCTLRSVSIQDPGADLLRRAIDPLGVEIAVTKAGNSRMEVKLSCPRGEVTLG